MIAKIVRYASLASKRESTSTQDDATLLGSLALARYILDLKLSEADRSLLEEIGQIGRYGHDDHGDNLRVLDKAVFDLCDGDSDEQVREFAYRVAGAGAKSLRQLIVAYGEDQATEEMARRHLDVFRRVLRGETSSMIYAFHGDTNYDHFHVAICTLDNRTGKLGTWGQGMEIEAAHVAIAICEYQDNLTCEPNRRYVADNTGVYHTWSGKRVADQDGVFLNRGVFKVVQAEQTEFDLEVEPPDEFCEGEALPATTAIKLLARGVIREAKTWDDLHRGLARVGVRYEPYTTKGQVSGGNLVINGATDKSDDRLQASSLNAGYKRLCKKFGNTPYQPPASHMAVRRFVYPEYRRRGEPMDVRDDAALEQVRARQQGARQEFEQFEARERATLEQKIDRVRSSAEERKKLKTREEKLRHHNEVQKQEKILRTETEELLNGMRLAFEKEEKRRERGRRSKTQVVHGVIDAALPPAQLPPEVHHEGPSDPVWAEHYKVKRSERAVEYWRGSTLAFVERPSFIALYADDRRSKVDALLRAQEKFGTVKVIGPPEFRREMLLLAAQTGIRLDKDQAREAKQLLGEHVKQNASSATSRIVFTIESVRQHPEDGLTEPLRGTASAPVEHHGRLKRAIEEMAASMREFRLIVRKLDDGSFSVPHEMVGHEKIVRDLYGKALQTRLRGWHDKQKRALEPAVFSLIRDDLKFEKSANGIKVAMGNNPDANEIYRKFGKIPIISDNLELIYELREKRAKDREPASLASKLVAALMGSQSAWEELKAQYGLTCEIAGSQSQLAPDPLAARKPPARADEPQARKPTQTGRELQVGGNPQAQSRPQRRPSPGPLGLQQPPNPSPGRSPWDD